MNIAPHGVMGGSIIPHTDRRAVLAFATSSPLADASGVIQQLDMERARECVVLAMVSNAAGFALHEAPVMAEHLDTLRGGP